MGASPSLQLVQNTKHSIYSIVFSAHRANAPGKCHPVPPRTIYRTNHVGICFSSANPTMPDPRRSPCLSCLPCWNGGSREDPQEGCCCEGEWEAGRKAPSQARQGQSFKKEE